MLRWTQGAVVGQGLGTPLSHAGVASAVPVLEASPASCHKASLGLCSLAGQSFGKSSDG